MENKDFTSTILSLREKLTKPLMMVAVLCGIASVFLGWGFMGLAGIIVIFVTFLNGMYVIMPGNAGYKITLGKLASRSYPAGFGWMIPFVSSMTPVDITRQRHEDTNTLKNKNRREVTLRYILTWALNPDNIHILHATIGENEYINKALCPQLDTAFTEVISSKTYDEINADLANIASEVKDNYELRYDHNLFVDVEINIIEVKFDTDYEKTIAEAATVEMRKDIVEKQAEQLRISAKAKADARVLLAEGEAAYIKKTAEAEAEGLKLKGASENEIKEKLGEILKGHPELIREVLAKNFPKVYGSGATPLINLDELLGNKQ